jgi:hypothetical protein
MGAVLVIGRYATPGVTRTDTVARKRVNLSRKLFRPRDKNLAASPSALPTRAAQGSLISADQISRLLRRVIQDE